MVGKVLIVDDVATNRIVMKVKLAAAGYYPILAADGAACIAAALRDQPDLILLDLMLPDMSGLDVLARLRSEPSLRHVPVVMFSASQDQTAPSAAFRAGADEFLAKPIDDQTLLARIRSFMRSRDLFDGFSGHRDSLAMLGFAETQPEFLPPGIIAIVVNRPDTAHKIRRNMAQYLNERVLVLTAEDALADGFNQEPSPDVFLIEADCLGTDGGLRLMSELRSRGTTRHAAFCILSSPNSVTGAAVAFDLGAADLVTEAIADEELAMRLSRLLARKREADALRASMQDGLRLAIIDPLTGLHNRRYGLAQLSAISDAAQRSGQGFAVLVLDLDRFKSVNDRWGHAAGDAVLMEVANRLNQNLRAGDLLARMGGEEFLIALPETSLTDACTIAERLCRAIEVSPVHLSDTNRLNITISIGLSVSGDVADLNPKNRLLEIIECADRALLNAKAAGRNQVTISQSAA
jgi:two-component system, cell cycle response regulator